MNRNVCFKTNEVQEALYAFQKGYTERIEANASQFVNELFSAREDALIIGTGFGEWCKGKEEILELIQIDWKYWGNLKLDIENAVVSFVGDVAVVNLSGDLSKGINEELLFSNCKDRMKETLESGDTNKDKMYKSLKLMSYYLYECCVGEEVGRSVRLSATLVQENEKWKFYNLHFSYAVAPPTDVRIRKSDLK